MQSRDLNKLKTLILKEVESKLMTYEEDIDDKLNWFKALINDVCNTSKRLNANTNKNIDELHEIFKLNVILSVFAIILSLLSIVISIF